MSRHTVGVIQGVSLGVALASVAAAAAWPEPEVVYQVEVVERVVTPRWADVEPVPTPVIDSLMDEGWEERMDRESDCLFEFLRAHLGYEITLDAVLAGGSWTEALGGACVAIGEDDE